MSELFLAILSMNLTASYVILFVILIRLLIKKAPKFISYALWGVVAFRLTIPFSFESMFSLLPRKADLVSSTYGNILQQGLQQQNSQLQSTQLQSGMEVVETSISNSLPAPMVGASVNPFQLFVEIGSYLWVIGIVALLVYSLLSVIILNKQLKYAEHLENNIFEVPNLRTPFVLGLIKPRIYLPMGLKEEERGYILLHEQTHIKRNDHVIKVVAFLILSLHWFNPLVWLAFLLMSTDMELSCDEKVLKIRKDDIKKPYANSLLSLATGRRFLTGSPLAFGEGNVKMRILNVLNYKAPKFWVVLVTAIIAIGISITLIANPATNDPDLSFLNPNRLLSRIAEQEQILIKSVEYGNTSVSGSELARWLDRAENDWKRKRVSSPYELSPSITIYVEEENRNEIRFYESEPTLVMIIDQDQYRYYNIPDEHYISMKEMAGMGDPQVQSDKKLLDQSDFDVERNLGIIMSSPSTSSNPQDYIDAHVNEYEEFFKYGGEDALQYMLDQFEVSNAEGLRGHIMMRLCKELLGARNNVTDDKLSPQGWYNALRIRQEIILPSYEYEGNDTIEKLVYDTLIERNAALNNQGFIIVAPRIIGSYEEDDMLKIFATTYSASYQLYDSTLSQVGGSIIPAAITFRNDEEGGYELIQFEEAQDGSRFAPSIKEYCTMPVSGKRIKGLADKILEHYSDYEDILNLMNENLYQHLMKNGIKDATLTNSQGEIIFSTSDPKFKQ